MAWTWHSVEGAVVRASASIVPLLEIYEKFHVYKQNNFKFHLLT
jgi:hypothetical protein